MPRTVNPILNKQFPWRAFELPAAGTYRWLQSEIRRSFAMKMAGQIKNTLRSLLSPYRRNIATDDYEITLIDNGSTRCCRNQRAHGPSTGIPSESEIFG
jgi:hypothetical protein